MKKYSFIIAALFAFAAVACQKETADPRDDKAAKEKQNETVETDNPSSCEVTVFTAKLPEGSLVTRTVIGEADGEGKYTPLWTAKDAIIVNGVKSTDTELVSDGASAKFTVAGVEAPYLVLAPGSMFGRDGFSFHSETNTYNYLVSGAGRPQKYTLNGANPTYDPDNGTVIAAYSNDAKELTFHHLCVYYKITVNAAESEDSDNIRSIYIRQGDGGNIAGSWTATLSENDITIAPPSSPTNVIKLDCGENGVAHGTPMIVAVPAYNFDSGLIITLKDVNGHFCSYKMKSAATQFAASAGTIFDFEPKFSPGPGTINNAEDWEAFAAAVNSNDDKDLYRWVGNGTVKIGADFTAGNLTKIVGAGGKFIYNVDGQNHTITRTAGTGALFRNVRGTVSNLNLAGSIETTARITAALADTLYVGGRIENCNNGADITVTASTYGISGGIAAIMTGGTISHCSNTAAISVAVPAGQANLQAAGIVGQVNNNVSGKPCGDATIEYCNNSGAILGDPICDDSTKGITFAAVGGIAAWLRGTAYAFTIDNCSNIGPITYSGEHVGADGMAYCSVLAGGIVGIASDMETGYPNYESGLDVTISDCTNTGEVHNCGINVSSGIQNLRHIFTGGIAGSFMGNSDKHASMTSCKNKGTLLTYDLTGDAAYAYPEYCQVVGGLVGYCGFADIDGCTVNCTIGNGKRACNSIGGAIGHAIRTFSVSSTKIWFTLYFTRINSVNHINSATVAVAPMKYGSDSNSTQISLEGSTVSDTHTKGTGFYYNVTSGSTDDVAANCNKSFNLTTQMVRGNPTSGNSEAAKVTFSGDNSALTQAPED